MRQWAVDKLVKDIVEILTKDWSSDLVRAGQDITFNHCTREEISGAASALRLQGLELYHYARKCSDKDWVSVPPVRVNRLDLNQRGDR